MEKNSRAIAAGRSPDKEEQDGLLLSRFPGGEDRRRLQQRRQEEEEVPQAKEALQEALELVAQA
jgi:hypothetical protein